jgi:hypothetical protein
MHFGKVNGWFVVIWGWCDEAPLHQRRLELGAKGVASFLPLVDEALVVVERANILKVPVLSDDLPARFFAYRKGRG